MRLAENSEHAILQFLDARARDCSGLREALDLVSCLDVSSLPASRPRGWAREVWGIVLALRRRACILDDKWCVPASDGYEQG